MPKQPPARPRRKHTLPAAQPRAEDAAPTEQALTPKQRRAVAAVIASRRAQRRIPHAGRTEAERAEHLEHRRAQHKHTAEVLEELGSTRGKHILSQAERQAPPGVDVNALAEAMGGLRLHGGLEAQAARRRR